MGRNRVKGRRTERDWRGEDRGKKGERRRGWSGREARGEEGGQEGEREGGISPPTVISKSRRLHCYCFARYEADNAD